MKTILFIMLLFVAFSFGFSTGKRIGRNSVLNTAEYASKIGKKVTWHDGDLYIVDKTEKTNRLRGNK